MLYCLTWTVVPKIKPPFYWFILHVLSHARSSLKFDHVFINAAGGIIGNTSQKTVIEVAYYRSNFMDLANFFKSFVIFAKI